MLRQSHYLLSLLLLLSLTITSVMSAEPIFSKNGVAIKGYDPVAYFEVSDAVKGSKEFSHEWNGATWLFSSDANKELFVANPEKFAPQYGGYCAYAVAKGSTAPISPDAWSVHEGKLYLNFSKGVKKKWSKDIPGNIEKADANWPSVL